MTTAPELDTTGFLRWFWRQLTSMRIALILLLLLGVASVPGSILPQRNQNPMKVQEFFTNNPQLAQWMDRFRLFDVYSSPWFSAIYLLLFLSLIGCVLPRTFDHLKAIGAKPPLTPKFLDRMEFYREVATNESANGEDQTLDTAEKWLRKNRFRVRRDEFSISAEKGYLRESGNLLFHLSLLMILVAVGIGGLYGSKGEAILNVGDRFVNTPTSYDNLGFGKFQSEGSLTPFSLRITDFRASYDPVTNAPTDYKLTVAAANPVGSQEVTKVIKVNSPLTYGSTKIYLQANGYSPVVSIKDKSGSLIFEGAVPFLPQDGNLTSSGAIKVPDMKPQIGFVATFLPTADRSATRGAFSSYPEVLDPRLLFSAWSGNLGLDSGVPQSVYRVDTSKMQRIGLKALKLGESYNFGVGTITFEGWKSWVNLQIVDDPGKMYALFGAIFAVLGLLTSLFTRQRRIWVKVDGRVQVAGLAKNGVPGLQEEIDRLTVQLEQKLEG
jgi:cytochrome c biogenesis protein